MFVPSSTYLALIILAFLQSLRLEFLGYLGIHIVFCILTEHLALIWWKERGVIYHLLFLACFICLRITRDGWKSLAKEGDVYRGSMTGKHG